MTAKELLSEKGLPVQIVDALNCADEETMKKSIETFEKVFADYKANATQVKFKGCRPSASQAPSSELAGDMELRKAMGLRT